MKNLTKKIIITGGLSLALVTPAFASTTVVLSPSFISTSPGKTFTMTVSVNSQGTKNYAEKVELTYPADVLEVKSFTFAPNWIQLTQPGYDSIDNSGGSIVKSAGFPSGLDSLTVFGTVTFYVKNAGTGNIKIGANSAAFDSSSQTPMTGNDVIVDSSPSPVIPVPSSIPTTKVSPPLPVKSSVTVTPTTTSVTLQSPTSPKTTNFVSNLAATIKSNFNLNWLWIILAVMFLPGIYYSLRGNKKS